METFSALLTICAGNSPVPSEFPTRRPVTRSFDVFFYLRLNKRLSKQWWGWWFETLSHPLWRHRNPLFVKMWCILWWPLLGLASWVLYVVCFIHSRTLAPGAVICWLYPTQNKFYLIFSYLSYLLSPDILKNYNDFTIPIGYQFSSTVRSRFYRGHFSLNNLR